MSSRASPGRAEHMGSLLRPAEFLDTLKKETDSKVREELENREIDIIVKDQLNLGFRIVNDGEYRRTLFWGSFFESLSGFEEAPLLESNHRTYLPKVTALLEYHIPTTLVCTSKIGHKGNSPHLQEFLYLKSIVPADRIGDIKITIPPPHWYHLRYKHGQAYRDGVYASEEEYFQDLAAAYRTELQILYDAGLRRVQLDDPDLSYFCSSDVIEAWDLDKTNKQSTSELLASYIQLYNDCLKDVKADMHIGIHVCRGNFTDSRYWSAGGYDAIASQLFRDLNVNTFYLEFDTARAGGFEPLKSLLLNKNVVLGVVSTKSPQLEDIDELKERVHRAAEFIAKGNNVSPEQALQRLGVSPQCGFASNSNENRLTKHNMLDKLNLVRELANSIWPGEA
ncbi:hypothetical protein N7493_004536 [Penicillium malachiteum]|uniref:Cobalamin-independent methionine synthase MetE C-terminal/archaeal domain-containing protein n=1 Tax=Penicillium malachiteum TaxID=1324776 RepID=A0AAD6HPP8_9EURO|nr:hypothetical protein N7493_004536 [Penicillium malachiteum]